MSTALAGLEALGRNLAAATLVGALLAALALLLRRPLRRLPPRLQAWCWWLVAARLLLELAGAPAIELAWLPRAATPAPPALELAVSSSDSALQPRIPAAEPDSAPLGASAAVAPPRPAATLARSRSALWAAVAALWLVGVGATLARLAAGLRRVARSVARATPVDDAATLAAFDLARRCAGVTRPVHFARSHEIATPLATGLRRPVVLLPASARLAPAALRLVLVHELVHLRRRDGWRALVPALARRLFFFHPLAVWAEREHALATEAACDAEVVARAEASAATYGELLVEFTLGSARRPRLAAAWSLAGPSIHRRLEMLAHDSLRPRHLAALAPFVALALIAVAAPIRLVAEDASTTPSASEAEEVNSEPLEDEDGWYGIPEPPAPPSPPTPGVRWSTSGVARTATPPSPPALPAVAAWPARPATPATPALPALAPLPPLPPMVPELRGADWLVLWERDAKLSIDATRWAQRRAEELGARDGRPVLLLGRGGDSWVVRDAATIDAIRQLFFEQRDAAQQQAEIAREHALAAREHSRLAQAESRRTATDAVRQVTFEAERVARLASHEAQRVAELQRELERMGGEDLAQARERAQVAARELEALERELARARTATDAERSRQIEAARQSFEADHRQLAAELEALAERAEESRRELEHDVERLERELERRLEQIFASGLAAPLEH